MGVNSSLSHLESRMTLPARLPPILALMKSGTCVGVGCVCVCVGGCMCVCVGGGRMVV